MNPNEQNPQMPVPEIPQQQSVPYPGQGYPYPGAMYPPPYPAISEAPKLKLRHWNLESIDRVFAWLAVLFGFLFVRYVVVKADGFITTGIFLLLFAGTAIYTRKKGCKPLLSHRILDIVIAAFCFGFSLTDSELLHGLNFLFLMTAIIWRVQAVSGKIPFVTRYFPLDFSDAVLSRPLRHFDSAPQGISESVKQSGTATKVRTVLVALLVTVPLTGIVAGLLAKADSGMEHLLRQMTGLVSDQFVTLLVQFAFGIPVGWWFFGMLFGGTLRRNANVSSDALHAQNLEKARILPNLGIYAGVTPICLLYLAYTVSQINYYVSAFAGRLPADMIYSEYARRGFFELCAITVINLAVIAVMTGCAKKGGVQRPKLLAGYAVVLCLFTLFIIATAIAKMHLYIRAYGLTQLRLYTECFMILLAVVFLVLLVRQFTAKIHSAAIISAAALVMFGGLCFSRPDALIAEYNLTRYEQGTLKELDIDTLTELSADAYLVLEQHPAALEKAGVKDIYERCREGRLEVLEDNPDEAMNLSAQMLISQAKKS